jgi:diaminopropionate ammonia-lyase
MSSDRGPYTNPDAKAYSRSELFNASAVKTFHESLPLYAPTPLVPLEELAAKFGVKSIVVKDEGNRLGLPSFKILGASWGTFRAIASKLNLPLESSLDELSEAAKNASIKLFAATDGNHGRAVAYMAKLLRLPAEIFVPTAVKDHERGLITNEGATVTVVEGDYDAAEKSTRLPSGLLIQDTSFEGYEDIPSWIVDGYSTMMHEIDSQLEEQGLKATIIITPVGVGSLATGVVSHAKSGGRSITTLAVEPDTAACLHTSLKAGRITPIETPGTIMTGLDCGTVSTTAWPVLRAGIDASITVSDSASHDAVVYLAGQGLQLGPCGAAGLAALLKIAPTEPGSVGLNSESVVVILGTEGTRPYSDSL